MSRYLFISHCSANAWLIQDLIDLVRMVAPSTEVFCSSDTFFRSSNASILPGENYKDAIYENLGKADLFIALLSEEYWRSKYCILELGAAYERYCREEPGGITILPLLLPPLGKDLALANTPLVELQVTDLTDPHQVSVLLNQLAEEGSERLVDDLRLRIAAFSTSVRKHALMTASLVDGITSGVYYDEPPHNPVPKKDVISYRVDDNGRFDIDFDLTRAPYQPSFASLALEYWNTINLRAYLAYDADAALTFELDNPTDALADITVEFKFGPLHEPFNRVALPLAKGINSLSIPLAPMKDMPLDRVNQICFVMNPNTMRHLKGAVSIERLTITLSERNLLA